MNDRKKNKIKDVRDFMLPIPVPHGKCVRPMLLVACVGRIMDAASTRKNEALRRIRDAPQRHLQHYAQIPGTHPGKSAP